MDVYRNELDAAAGRIATLEERVTDHEDELGSCCRRVVAAELQKRGLGKR